MTPTPPAPPMTAHEALFLNGLYPPEYEADEPNFDWLRQERGVDAANAWIANNQARITALAQETGLTERRIHFLNSACLLHRPNSPLFDTEFRLQRREEEQS